MSKISWKLLQTLNPPLARSSHGVSVINDKLYIFGGEHSARSPIGPELHSLDLNDPNPEWQEVIPEPKSKIPLPRFGHCQASIGDSIFLFGGRMGTSIEEKLLNDLWQFNTINKTWIEISNFKNGTEPPSPRSFQSSVAIGECIYVFGGCSAEGRLSDFHEYNTKEQSWKQLSSKNEIQGRGGTPLVVSPDKTNIYVLGGFAGIYKFYFRVEIVHSIFHIL